MVPAEAELQIRSYYRALYDAWGPQHWWPARTRFEVIVGAYLTQNTAWTNVERALANLRKARVLSIDGIRDLPIRRLQRLIRPSGYFRQKAARLKMFISFLDRKHGGSLTNLFAQSTGAIREQLLALNGIGPETADSILLYAGNQPIFVVDAYTRRIVERHGISATGPGYEDIRLLFERSLTSVVTEDAEKPADARPRLAGGLPGASHPPSPMSTARRTALTQVFNEMHGLIVGVGKNFCRKSRPDCESCPLREFLPRE